MSSSNNTSSKISIGPSTHPWHTLYGSVPTGITSSYAMSTSWKEPLGSNMVQQYLLVHKDTKALYLSDFSPNSSLLELPEEMILTRVLSADATQPTIESGMHLVSKYKLVGTVGQLLQHLAEGYKSE